MAASSPLGRADGPSRSSLDFAIEKEDEKTAVNGSHEESVFDTASDIRAEEAAVQPTSASAPRRTDGSSKVDPAALDIEYRYFTFTTELPPPNTTVSSGGDGDGTAPPPPDLKKYTDPHLWPNSRKNTLLALSCIATFLTAYSAGSFSPPAQRMADAFGVSLIIVLFAGITVFCLGFALAPMLLAPLSEYNGRYPVFVAAGCVFVIFQVVSGAAPDLGAMLVSRILVGVGGSVFSTMVGGVIADMWHAEGRNTPMTLFSGTVLFATGCGPMVSAVITYRTTYPQNVNDVLTDSSPRNPWRWVFWHQAIADAVLMIALIFLFHESRGSVLLSRKAKAINQWYQERESSGYFGVWLPSDNDDASLPPLAKKSQHLQLHSPHHLPSQDSIEGEPKAIEAATPGSPVPTTSIRRIRWVVKDDEDRTTVLRMVGMSVYRPFHMLVTEPVVFFFSLWVAFAWAVLYLTFGSIFLVFEEVYDFNIEQAGYAFSSMLVGATVATVMGLYQDRYLLKILPLPKDLKTRLSAGGVPEARLCGACVTSILLPVGLFIFGFTARPDYHWIAPMFGIGISTVGIFAVYLSTFNYLADVYHRYASSALAAQSCCRNVLGGIFPLVMRPLFTNLGISRAGALLGGIAVGLTLVPWVLLYFGETIRKRSKFAQSLTV
ncbi:hypothetical protein Sste5346_005148 [Sporothrix stenoceras]|uniref:Major facilitator superfamily (MFS) profile domain-containing protein n=1 Tax=Sporothrix stenoceras TaxID=5173 RepID=A0ABR3Z638_9PEZI